MRTAALLDGAALLGLRRLLTLETLPAPDGASREDRDPLPDGACWETVLRALEAHGLAPWAHEALGAAGLRDSLPGWVAARLRNHFRWTALRNRIKFEALDEIAVACAAAGVEIIPFKGAALARRLYRDPGLRPMHDLDLLVRPADFTAAAEALRRSGYSLLPHVDERTSRSAHFHCSYGRPGSGDTVELHWSLGEIPDVLPATLASLWELSAPGPAPGIRTLDTQSELTAIACHAWRHGILNPVLVGEERLRAVLFEPLSGNRLIWLLDLHRLMRRGEADPGVCRARALDWGVAPALRGAIVLAAEAFGPVSGWDWALQPQVREISLAHYLIARQLARGIAAGSARTVRFVERWSRMDPRMQARPIRALDLLDRFRVPARLRELRERHGAALLPVCWLGAALAGAAGLTRAGWMTVSSRFRRASRPPAPLVQRSGP